MKRWIARTFAALLVGIGAGCGKPAADNSPAPGLAGRTAPYRIVATVGMVADLVANVAGDRATVSSIIGEGIDPHLYTPARSDVNALVQADIVFYSGLLLEGKMTDVLEKVAAQGKPVFAVTAGIGPDYLLTDPQSPAHADPHVWMDAAGWMKAVEAVAAAMARVDPPHADAYRQRADAYLNQLASLDAYARQAIASVPAEQRVLVTAHDAFNYLGRAYGIEVRGIQGISTESEAGLDDVNRLVDLIVKRQVKAIFVETSVADKNVRALVEGARSRGHTIKVGGTLFSDAMGPKGTYEGTYLGMIDHNVTTIARALGGDAPAGGMQGKLKAATP